MCGRNGCLFDDQIKGVQISPRRLRFGHAKAQNKRIWHNILPFDNFSLRDCQSKSRTGFTRHIGWMLGRESNQLKGLNPAQLLILEEEQDVWR